MSIDRFTKDQFEEALPKDKNTDEPVWKCEGLVDGEYMYSIPVNGTNKRIMVRSSIAADGLAATSGSDSIRLWVEYKYDGAWHPLAKLDRWTTRVPGWERRVEKKLRELWKLALKDSRDRNLIAKARSIVDPDTVICPDCNSPMRLRNGKYGEFYGCSNYPKCRKTLDPKRVEVTKEKKVDKPKEFKPSEYQQNVFDFIINKTANLMVEAVAGSGKTTTIVEALRLTKGSVLFCAFNKHIQVELARRAPPHVEVSTIHAIGFRALIAAAPRKPQVYGNKLWDICKEMLPEDDQWPLRQPLAKLVSLCKKTLTDYTNKSAVESMADYYGVELDGDAEQLIGLVPQVMNLCAERLSVIDFDDMLWLPTQLGVSLPKFDWVFVDEAQDLSMAQMAIVRGSLKDKDGGRIIMVGDRHQGIYGFTGADCESIPRLIKEFDAETLPLSITYRCAKEITKLAQSIVPDIKAADWAVDGEIIHVSSFSWMRDVRDKDLVLCRVNAPLVKACYAFIRRGTKATIRGRDIGKGLLNFIDRLRPTDVYDLIIQVRGYQFKETTKLEAAGKSARAGAVQDRCDTLIALCEGVNDLTELRFRIKDIFDDKTKDGIILSSIHRSKGDEADNVFLLHPELLPHPLAKRDWQQVQERNLEYVAYTRAKVRLTIVEG